ncbi:MAG: thioredoxin family protein [Victivallales bacterium]|nr:thioredoxin family protein [Victivallales bacterium]
MKIQILGAGCAKCEELAARVEAAAGELGISYELEKITGIAEIMSFGVMLMPALIIDGEVKVSGRVPEAAELKEILAAEF